MARSHNHQEDTDTTDLLEPDEESLEEIDDDIDIEADEPELSVVDAIVQLTGESQKDNETGLDYSKRMYEIIKDFDDEKWEKLCHLNEDAAAWHNRYHRQVTRGKPVPVIPGVYKGLQSEAGSFEKRARVLRRATNQNGPINSVINRMWDIFIENPTIRTEDLVKQLESEGLKTAMATVNTTRSQVLRIIARLDAKGLINRDKLREISKSPESFILEVKQAA